MDCPWAAAVTIAVTATTAAKVGDRPSIRHAFEAHPAVRQNGMPVWIIPLPPPLLPVLPFAVVFRHALTLASIANSSSTIPMTRRIARALPLNVVANTPPYNPPSRPIFASVITTA